MSPARDFWGRNIVLRTYLPEVAGVTNGAPVRLDGVDIGNVESIKMVPRTPGHIPEKSRNIELIPAAGQAVFNRRF